MTTKFKHNRKGQSRIELIFVMLVLLAGIRLHPAVDSRNLSKKKIVEGIQKAWVGDVYAGETVNKVTEVFKVRE